MIITHCLICVYTSTSARLKQQSDFFPATPLRGRGYGRLWQPLFRLAPPYKAPCVLRGRFWLVPQILAHAAERPPLRDRVRGCCDQLMDCGFRWQQFTPTAPPPPMLPLLLVRSHERGLGFSSGRQTCASGRLYLKRLLEQLGGMFMIVVGRTLGA